MTNQPTKSLIAFTGNVEEEIDMEEFKSEENFAEYVTWGQIRLLKSVDGLSEEAIKSIAMMVESLTSIAIEH